MIGFLKNITRSFLSDEINELEEKVRTFENRNIELKGQMTTNENCFSDQKLELEKEIIKIRGEKEDAVRKIDSLEKENQILRRYYDLNKEPSDEIKVKVHIDLEINRLRDENLKLISMLHKQPICIQQPYPIYFNSFQRPIF